MQSSKVENVVFLKNIESNIIEEAFIVLKRNVKIKDNNTDIALTREDVLKEAELIINKNIEIEEKECLKFNLKRLRYKYNWLKAFNILFVILIGIKIII